MKTADLASLWVRSVFAVGVFVALHAEARVDRPDVVGWTGTAYHDGGWFTFQLATPYAAGGTYFDGAMKFDKVGEFALSPLYAAPVRKILLKTACSATAPTRFLRVASFVGGVEAGVPMSLVASADVRAQAFSFSPSSDVKAFRIFLDGSSTTGVWGISDICVFYGEKTADENDVFLEFMGRLPEPENLRAESIAANALTVAADSVPDAIGYRFAVDKLTGTPNTECRENFTSAPELSAGWAFGTVNNASMSMATSSYLDTKTSGDFGALKIEKTRDDEPVTVEILSPEFPSAIFEVSYVTKRSSGESTDEVAMFGRVSGEAGWVQIGEAFSVQTSQKWTTNAVDRTLNYRQVKFVFSSSAGSCRPCGVDTLRVVYGGDEARMTVMDGTSVLAAPRLELAGLETARYSFRAQAVAAEAMHDSSWTQDQVVDLAWAGVSVDVPCDVAVAASGDMLNVSWSEVTSAARYRVTVTPEDGSDVEPIVEDTTSTSAAVRVPALGEYVVTVTAFSPGDISHATSAGCAVEVSLGSLVAVTAEATDVAEITATWRAVPLAEGYLAKAFRISSNGIDRTIVETKSITGCGVVFSGLDITGRYVVEVSPQPSDGASLAAESGEVDLSAIRFRRMGAATLGMEGWNDEFTSLTNVTKKTELKNTALDFWQLYKGSGEALELMVATDVSKVAGLYACSDGEKTVASYALGTLANESYGCAIGIALCNGGDLAVERGVVLSFDMLQRVYRQQASGYVFEWKVTDGETSILSEDGWTVESIGTTAPYVDAVEHPEGVYRQSVSVTIAADRRILPGEVLLLRWTHPKVKNGPIMAIDNVRLSFTRAQSALRITIR